jgi:hypothetical protein
MGHEPGKPPRAGIFHQTLQLGEHPHKGRSAVDLVWIDPEEKVENPGHWYDEHRRDTRYLMGLDVFLSLVRWSSELFETEGKLTGYWEFQKRSGGWWTLVFLGQEKPDRLV